MDDDDDLHARELNRLRAASAKEVSRSRTHGLLDSTLKKASSANYVERPL